MSRKGQGPFSASADGGPFCVSGVNLILCECGCGQEAPIAKRTRASRGEVKGTQLRFVKGHHAPVIMRQKAAQRPPESHIKDYPRVTEPSGRVVKVHRLRAEQALGKPLPPGAEVHHVDGTKNPQSPLVICPNTAYHLMLHRRQRVLRAGGNPNMDKICSTCKRVKPQTEFRVSRHTSTGLHQACFACERERGRLYQRRKRESMRAAA